MAKNLVQHNSQAAHTKYISNRPKKISIMNNLNRATTSQSDNNSKDIFDTEIWSIYYGVFATEATTGIILNLLVIFLYRTRAVKKTTFNYLIAHLSAAHIAQLLGAILSAMMDVRQENSDNENVNLYYKNINNHNTSSSNLDYQNTGFIINNYTNNKNNNSNSHNSSNQVNFQAHSLTGGHDIIAYLSCGVGPGKSLSLAFTGTLMGILCTMSITQYIAITRPLLPMNTTIVKRIAKMQWLVGLLCACPNLLRMRPNSNGYNYCVLNTLFSRSFNRIYIFGAATVFYVIPWTILLFSFASVFYHFYYKIHKTDVGLPQLTIRKNREHVVRLMGVWAMIYAACWSSYAVFMVLMTINYYDHSPRGEILKHRLNCLTSLPCYAASTVNVCYYFYSVKVGVLLKRACTQVGYSKRGREKITGGSKVLKNNVMVYI